jgi:hypothetical protein
MVVAVAVKITRVEAIATAHHTNRKALPAELSDKHRKVRGDHGSEAGERRRTRNRGGGRFSAKTTAWCFSTATDSSFTLLLAREFCDGTANHRQCMAHKQTPNWSKRSMFEKKEINKTE